VTASLSEADLDRPIEMHSRVSQPFCVVTVPVRESRSVRRRDRLMAKMDRSVSKVNALVLFKQCPERVIKFPACSIGILWKQQHPGKHPVQTTSEAAVRKVWTADVV